MTRRRNSFLCLDCNVNTNKLGEYYSLADAVWLEAHPTRDGMLCVGCVERRLGRTLRSADFIKCPLNAEQRASRINGWGTSDRLYDRLNSRRSVAITQEEATA